MASEIRVDKINSLSGVGTVTLSPTGVDIAGITTAATLRATTGIVTSLTAGSLTSLGAISGTTGTFSSDVSVAGDFQVPDVIKHEGDVNTKIRFPAADTITAETAGSERVRIDSDGKIGIGTASPATDIHTLSSSDHIITHQSGTAGADVRLNFRDTGSIDQGGIHYAFNGNSMRLRTAQGERLRITSAGDLGINVTSPSAKLDVVDDSASGYIAEFRQGNTSNSGQIVIDSPTNSDSRPPLIELSRAGTLQWSIGQGYNSSGGAFHLATSSLSAGVTGVKASFLAGGGLTFNGDTANSNALDDYEEGTFSPNFKAANASGNSNTTVQEAKYIKIGGLIYFTFYIDMNAHGDDTGGMAYIEGLPYTSAGRHFSVSIGYFNSLLQSQSIFTGTVQPSSNNILLRHATGAATALAGMDYSNAIGTSSELICSGTYSVV